MHRGFESPPITNLPKGCLNAFNTLLILLYPWSAVSGRCRPLQSPLSFKLKDHARGQIGTEKLG